MSTVQYQTVYIITYHFNEKRCYSKLKSNAVEPRLSNVKHIYEVIPFEFDCDPLKSKIQPKQSVNDKKVIGN